MVNLDVKQGALLLIEFQNEWLEEKGKLHSLFTDKTQFKESLDNAKNIIEAARGTSLSIIHSGLSFTSGYKELGSASNGLRAAIPRHQTFLSESNASQFTVPFNPHVGEFIVSGRLGSSAFAGSNLDRYLRNNDIKTLYIMGYAMHVCVESTIRAAHDLGYETILIEDATSAFNLQQKSHVLTEIIHHFGTTIKSKDFVTALKQEVV